MKNLIKRFNKNEAGATAIEYGFSLGTLGNNMSSRFTTIATAVGTR
ncbi:MAG: hypothetical protein FD128_1236 [Hyphomonadaceae bacterium]|nr:MAG: hypothetical protein FD128_1236 [Hyphomonadaceae bacterium]